METSNSHPNGDLKSQFGSVKEPSDAVINQVLTMSQQTVESKLDETNFILHNHLSFDGPANIRDARILMDMTLQDW